MRLTILLVILFFFIGNFSYAQEKEAVAFRPHHTLGAMISHTQISRGIQSNGRKKMLSLPSWALNYNYKISPKWAIGLHNDIVVEDFVVEEHLRSGNNKQFIERSYPIASALMVSYKPGRHFSFMVGAGGEFAHTGNLVLIRIGTEYSYHISKICELNAAITNDFKVNSYNSWALGLGVSVAF